MCSVETTVTAVDPSRESWGWKRSPLRLPRTGTHVTVTVQVCAVSLRASSCLSHIQTRHELKVLIRQAPACLVWWSQCCCFFAPCCILISLMEQLVWLFCTLTKALHHSLADVQIIIFPALKQNNYIEGCQRKRFNAAHLPKCGIWLKRRLVYV